MNEWTVDCSVCGKTSEVDMIFLHKRLNLVFVGTLSCCRGWPIAEWDLDRVVYSMVDTSMGELNSIIYSTFEAKFGTINEFLGINLIGKFTAWTDDEGNIDPEMVALCKDNIQEAIREFKELRGEL